VRIKYIKIYIMINELQELISDQKLYEDNYLNKLIPILKTPEDFCSTRCLDYHEEIIKEGKSVKLNATLEERLGAATETTLTLKVNPYNHKLNTYQISSSISSINEIESLQKNFGIDALGEMAKALISESSNLMTNLYIQELDDLALKNLPEYKGFLQKTIAWCYKLFGKTYRPLIKIKNQRELLFALLVQRNLIAHTSRLGPANFAIVNSRIASVLQNNSSFISNAPKQVQHNIDRLYPIGTIAGLEIYVDANKTWINNSIIVGYKSAKTQPGLLLVYKENSNNLMLITEKTFASKLILKSKYNIIKHGLKPELNYRKIELDFDYAKLESSY